MCLKNNNDVATVDVIHINDKLFIEKKEYKGPNITKNDRYYDVILNFPNEKIFIGRFNKTDEQLDVKYNDGKILVCLENYLHEIRKFVVVDVLSLYEVVDDTFYSCTAEEALAMFDSSIDSKYLKDKDRHIVRSDPAKRQKL